MGKEQDLLQAVKSGDLLSTQKLLSKLKMGRNSKSAVHSAGAPGHPRRGRSKKSVCYTVLITQHVLLSLLLLLLLHI